MARVASVLGGARSEEKKSEIASKNRRTEVTGLGTGMSRHTGGSKSTIEHARDFGNIFNFKTFKYLAVGLIVQKIQTFAWFYNFG